MKEKERYKKKSTMKEIEKIKMKKAVIFDIDNTLIDFMERKKITIKESVKAMINAGIDEDFEILHKEFADFYWKNGIEDQKIFQKFLKKKFGKVDHRILAHAILAYRKASNGLLHPYPGAKSVLIYLKERGFKLAILSDASKLEAHLRICAVGLDDFFDVILTKGDVKFTKPNSKGFKMAAKKLGVELEECIMIGDNISRDIDGGKKLGMTTIQAKYGLVIDNPDNNPKEKIDADYVAENIRDIIKIVEKIK